MNIIKVGLFSVIGALMTGCASHSDVAAVKTEALQAAADADRKAEDALAMAREAKHAAQEANARSQRNEEMLNRGFKRSMYK